MIPVQFYNDILGLATILGQIVILLLVIGLVVERMSGKSLTIISLVHRHALSLGLAISVAAVAGSLTYSGVFGYEPCNLCWYQRIFMYPQAIIFAVALYKKYEDATYYSLVLSVIGALIATLHYYGQMFNESALPCAAIGYSASCSQRFVVEFGYITIPLMALTAFAMLLVIIGIRRFRKI